MSRAPSSQCAGPGVALVVKQALPRLRVADEWIAPARRTDTEAAALRLAGARHPRPRAACRRQRRGRARRRPAACAGAAGATGRPRCSPGRAHAASGRWAGDTLGRLHAATAGDAEVAAAFGDYEAFAQLRLEPYHGVVMERLPDLAAALEPLVDELRDARTCLVHGDYAPKNILLGRDGAWIARRRGRARTATRSSTSRSSSRSRCSTALSSPRSRAACSELVHGFADGLRAPRGGAVPVPRRSLVAHTGAMLLARTDGRSPATFLGARAAAKARALGRAPAARARRPTSPR